MNKLLRTAACLTVAAIVTTLLFSGILPNEIIASPGETRKTADRTESSRPRTIFENEDIAGTLIDKVHIRNLENRTVIVSVMTTKQFRAEKTESVEEIRLLARERRFVGYSESDSIPRAYYSYSVTGARYE